MQIRFSLLSSDMVGIGVYRTMYETNLEVASNPAIATLKEQIEEGVRKNLGMHPEAVENDRNFSMRLAVSQFTQLGVKVPSAKYTLIVTESNCITRLPVEFRLQEIGG